PDHRRCDRGCDLLRNGTDATSTCGPASRVAQSTEMRDPESLHLEGDKIHPIAAFSLQDDGSVGMESG
ncbi:MAG: hypothetical protein WCC59_18990, partial [Terriglobales bacterium]